MLFMGQRKEPHSSNDGIEWVCCRICGDHRRVISGRHLSKHNTDRENYMQQYHLSPDELIAKAFRVMQSSRHGYYNGQNEWIAAMKKVYKKEGKVFAGYLQDKNAHLYEQGIWIFGDWDKALHDAAAAPEKMGK